MTDDTVSPSTIGSTKGAAVRRAAASCEAPAHALFCPAFHPPRSNFCATGTGRYTAGGFAFFTLSMLFVTELHTASS